MALKKGKYGSVINKYGVLITKAELRKFQTLTAKANRVLTKAREERKTAVTKEESNFYKNRRYAINRFQNRETFESYLRQTSKIAKGTYERNALINYRKNYIKGLYTNFGEDASKLANKVKRLSLQQFKNLVDNDVIDSIGVYYVDDTTSEDELLETNIELIDAYLGVRPVGRPRKTN